MSIPPLSPLQKLATLLKEMAARQDYHFPIVAAQRQFRERYYGLSSAAMLEDLFLDAVAHYVSTYRPELNLERPPRGEKGWDYSLDGFKVSHKVSKSGAPSIAVLWDATRTDLTHYTYSSPISLTIGGYSPSKIQIKTSSNHILKAKPIERDLEVTNGSSLILVRWDAGTNGEILFKWHAPADGLVQDVFGFRPIWAEVARASVKTIPANFLELLLIDRNSQHLSSGDIVEMGNPCRPGTYLIPKESLKDVPVTTNNRAVLIDKKLISNLMDQALNSGLFIPMPTWFSAFAGDRPPDLYLAQKRNYDDFFSSGSK
jgi:hypothetical protein